MALLGWVSTPPVPKLIGVQLCQPGSDCSAPSLGEAIGPAAWQRDGEGTSDGTAGEALADLGRY